MAELKERVQDLIDNMINPAVAGHGGYIELIDVKESTAYIRMSGAVGVRGGRRHAQSRASSG